MVKTKNRFVSIAITLAVGIVAGSVAYQNLKGTHVHYEASVSLPGTPLLVTYGYNGIEHANTFTSPFSKDIFVKDIVSRVTLRVQVDILSSPQTTCKVQVNTRTVNEKGPENVRVLDCSSTVAKM